MTLDTYADLFDADLDDLSARMGELLFAGGVGKMWARQVEPTSTAVTDAGVSAGLTSGFESHWRHGKADGGGDRPSRAMSCD